MARGISIRSIAKVSGWLLYLEGIFLCVPLVVALCYHESDWFAFLMAIVAAVVVGSALSLPQRGRKIRMGRREGYLLTSLVWIFFSIIGMIPFMLCAEPLDVAPAFFETMSGFTTTGASVIVDVEAQSHAILIWRAMMQWLGGLGIVLFLLALLPSLNQAGGIYVYNAETTGITHDKLHPRIRQTAVSLWKIYMLFTAVEIILLWIGPMDLFDSVCQSMSTVSTGGFSTRNDSIAAWDSNYVACVVIVFMFLSGVSFNLLYAFFHGDWRAPWRNDVFRSYLLIIFGTYLLLAVYIFFKTGLSSISGAIVKPLFHVISAMTTTGFSFGQYTEWGQFCIGLTCMLMVFGACAGSTSGAFKVDRIVALAKNIVRQIHITLFPNHIVAIEVNGRQVSSKSFGGVAALLCLFFIAILACALILCAEGRNLEDAFFTTLSCLGNNGLGYGLTGSGFYTLSHTSMWVLSLAMLIGRLEFFTVITVFTATFWRK